MKEQRPCKHQAQPFCQCSRLPDAVSAEKSRQQSQTEGNEEEAPPKGNSHGGLGIFHRSEETTDDDIKPAEQK